MRQRQPACWRAAQAGTGVSAESSWRLQHALLVSSSGFGEMVQQRQQKCRWREREAASPWASFMPLPEQHAEARLAAAREASAESSWRLQHALLVSSSGFGEMVQQSSSGSRSAGGASARRRSREQRSCRCPSSTPRRGWPRRARRRPLEMRRAERATSARRSRRADWLDKGREVVRIECAQSRSRASIGCPFDRVAHACGIFCVVLYHFYCRRLYTRHHTPTSAPRAPRRCAPCCTRGCRPSGPCAPRWRAWPPWRRHR